MNVLITTCLPLWKRKDTNIDSSKTSTDSLSLKQVVKIRGVKLVLVTFLAYCALENTAGLWASSYLVEFRGISTEVAARFASLFYLGITFGRFLSGFISDKLGDKRLIRYGLIVITIGIILVGFPFVSDRVALLGFVVIGIGCAPVYPSIIHATPSNFGKENSQAIIGIQMASAYTGSTFMPPLFGLIADNINIGLYPLFLLSFAVLMIIMSERLNKMIAR